MLHWFMLARVRLNSTVTNCSPGVPSEHFLTDDRARTGHLPTGGAARQRPGARGARTVRKARTVHASLNQTVTAQYVATVTKLSQTA